MNSKKSSRIFFFLLASFFLITAPVVIFYALGYRYSVDRGIFIYGGSVTIKSNPESINVLIDGKSVPQRKINFINNSYHIDGIRPGVHRIDVSAEGFESWSKFAEVHSGVSSEFWNILLTKKSYNFQPISEDKIERFFSSPKNDKIALVKVTENSISLSLYDIADNVQEEFFSSSTYKFSSGNKENVEWSPQEHKILIPVESDEGKNYFIIDTKNKNAVKLTDIAKVENIDNARWDTDNKNVLYFVSDGNLYQMNTEQIASVIRVAEHISDYDLSGSKIYIFRNDSGIIYRLSNNDFSDLKQITTSPPQDMTNPDYRIVVYDEKRIAIINDKTQKLWIFNVGDLETYFRELAHDIEDVQFSNDGKKLLFWSDHELYAYFNREWDVQPIRRENELLNITRYSQTINNVQWSKDYEHIVFSVGNELKVIELDHRDRHIGMNIVNDIASDSDIVADLSRDQIYISQPSRNKFGFIKFPESTGLFGT